MQLKDLVSARFCTKRREQLLATQASPALPISKAAGRGMQMVTLSNQQNGSAKEVTSQTDIVKVNGT